ncbi:MAG: hypothetical protein D4R77_06505 [Planctomycetaceae bacterium]|nr:MAG: hypothetical protein D4R77_06505 [Planctomycetaceae bacterium]
MDRYAHNVKAEKAFGKFAWGIWWSMREAMEMSQCVVSYDGRRIVKNKSKAERLVVRACTKQE